MTPSFVLTPCPPLRDAERGHDGSGGEDPKEHET